MGKAVSFVLACGALGVLAPVVISRPHNLVEDAGLLAGFLVLSAIAWLVALTTAVFHALRFSRGWPWVAALIALLWLPALPVLAFGISGLFSRRARRTRHAGGPRTEPPTPAPDEVLVSWRHALKDEVHA
jgi:hypothetical protein